MDSNKDFHQSMHQLVELLKKVILHLPFPTSKESPSSSKDQNVHVNYCFFNFLPMTPAEMDEFEEMYDEFLTNQEERISELKSDLTMADREFLKQNGIRF